MRCAASWGSSQAGREADAGHRRRARPARDSDRVGTGGEGDCRVRPSLSRAQVHPRVPARRREPLRVGSRRERRSRLFTLLREDARFDLRTTNLGVGDYVVDGRVVVERKTMEDFAASVIDTRLFRQASALQRHTASRKSRAIGLDKCRGERPLPWPDANCLRAPWPSPAGRKLQRILTVPHSERSTHVDRERYGP
ncbi:hypothetical protein JYT86_00680 [bacterium AH-315-N03]|nr:hypothetical protein [bacterium AH-315-N03]